MINRVERLAWGVAHVALVRCSPRFCHRWRNWVYRAFGAKMHATARVYPTARVWLPRNLSMGEHACIGDYTDVYNVAPVAIGARSTVSQYSYLCAASHDFEDPSQPLTTAPITLGENVWLAADVFIGPGVTIADGVVVGARSSVFRSDGEHALPAWHLCAGSPAKPVRKREFRPRA